MANFDEKKREREGEKEKRGEFSRHLQSCSRGGADEQLLFHLFDILFKCFTCRDAQIPRDKRPNVSCFHKDTAYRFKLFAEDEQNLSRMRRNKRNDKTQNYETHGTFYFDKSRLISKFFLKIKRDV